MFTKASSSVNFGGAGLKRDACGSLLLLIRLIFDVTGMPNVRYHVDVWTSNSYLAKGHGYMKVSTTSQRIAWSLADIAKQTGLSLGFLRNEVRAARLPIRKFGRRVLVLDEDLRRYLNEGSKAGKEVQHAV